MKSLTVLALKISYWDSTLGVFNKTINNLFDEQALVEIKNNLDDRNSKIRKGNRWKDKNRDFSHCNCFPEMAYLTLNNVDYGRLKFGSMAVQRMKTKSKNVIIAPYTTQYKLFKIDVCKELLNKIAKIDQLKSDKDFSKVFILDIDLDKAHSNIGFGITQSQSILTTQEILKTEKWEGFLKRLDCPNIKGKLENGSLNFESVKKALKALYYKGMQGGNLSTIEAIRRTFKGAPGQEEQIKLSLDIVEDDKLKNELSLAWENSIFNKGLQAFPNYVGDKLKQRKGINIPLVGTAIDKQFTSAQVGDSSPLIRITSDVLTNIEFILVVKLFNILIREMRDYLFVPILYEADGITVILFTKEDPDFKFIRSAINSSLDSFANRLYKGPAGAELDIIYETSFK